MHPLDGPGLKARRAKLHLNALQRSIKGFIDRNPYTVSKHDSGEYLEYFIKRGGDLPDAWGLMAGDFAHNLRSSLDHIAYEFNIRSSKPVAETTCQFPIFDTRAGYRSRGKRMFTSKPKGVKRKVENLQPYHRRKHPELQLLTLLRDLDNTDKHRTITPVLDHTQVELSETLWRASLLGAEYAFDLDHGGYRVIVTPRVREKIGDQFYPQLAVQVVFDVTERVTGHIYRIGMGTLNSIYLLVNDYMLPQFRDFFVEVPEGWGLQWRTKPITQH